jgi:hypothetical protein
MTKSSILIAMCSALLAFTACKKKEDAGSATGTMSSDKPSAEAKPTDKPMAPAAAPAAAPAGGAAVADVGDYEKRALVMMDKLIGLFSADGSNCDKLAGDLTKALDDNKAEIDAIVAYEKAHPDDKKAVDKKTKAKTDEFMAKATPALDACKNSKPLADALAKMPQ